MEPKADETQHGGQVPAGEQPQAGNAPTNSTTPSQPQSGEQPQAGTHTDQQQQSPKPTLEELIAAKERLERELADTRKEAAAHRVKAKQLDQRIADEEAAKLSDVEKAQKRAEAAEAREKTTRERIAKSELKLAAKDAGIIDPDDATAFLLGKVAYDEDGEPKDVAALVAGLKASKPHLFAVAAPATPPAAPRPSAGAPANPSRSDTHSGAGLTADLIGQMTHREYAARRAEVQEWLRTHSNR